VVTFAQYQRHHANLARRRDCWPYDHFMSLLDGNQLSVVKLREHPETVHGLRCALGVRPCGGVLWLRSDVALKPTVFEALLAHIALGESCAAVTEPSTRRTAVRYTVDPDGRLRQLAAGRREGLGELAGVTYLAPADRGRFVAALDSCAAGDRAEHALAIAIAGGMVVHPVDVGEPAVLDVDTDADLRRAGAVFDRGSAALPEQRRRVLPSGGNLSRPGSGRDVARS
jgi:hypothetical protein